MSVKRLFSLITALVLYFMFSPAAGAKSQFTLQFDVIDEYSREEMNKDSLRVDVMAPDSTMIYEGLTFRNFYQKWFDHQALLLRFYQPGFVTQYVKVKKPGSRVVYLRLDPVVMPRDLRMREKNLNLNEVTVTATKLKMVHKGDTIVYNADAFQLGEGSMLDQLVKALPGVELRRGGKIYVNGRYVKSLLLNGNDFFKGNPTVALSNLPSYIVSKVKVYEKEDVRSRMAGEDKKDLVMDVNLKKEYMHGWIANAEAGYGTDGRYVGRLFGLHFSNMSRFSVFGNINNTNDAATPGEQDEWNPQWQEAGIVTTHKAGLDYMLNDKRSRWKFDTSFTATRTGSERSRESDELLFIPSGDINKTLNAAQSARSYDFELKPHFFMLSKDVLMDIRPEVGYNRSKDDSEYIASMQQAATGQAMNTERRAARGWNDRWYANLSFNSMYSVPSTPDNIMVDMKAHYEDNSGGTNGFYSLDYPNAAENNTSQQYREVKPQTKWDVWGRVKYGLEFPGRRNGLRTRLFTRYSYSHEFRKDNRNYYDSTISELLPSDARGRQMSFNIDNSYRSKMSNNIHSIGALFRHDFAPGIKMDIDPSLTYANRAIEYHRFGNDYNLTRNDWTFDLEARVSIKYVSIEYIFKTMTPSMIDLLDITDATNPLYINKGNSALKPTHTHALNLSFWNLQKILHSDTYPMISFGYKRYDNAIARSAAYDPLTGVTTYRPENINGNWALDGSMSSGYYLDRHKRMMLTTATDATYVNSVDLINLDRSVVRTLTLSEKLKLDYKIIDGLNVAATGNVVWRNSTSPQPAFAKINAVDFDYGVNVNASKLPWNMAISTDITMHSRRGYYDPRLNDNHLVWNARISKSILKGNLTFALDGYDILGQLSNVTYQVNAQAQTETRYNTLPRYAMLHVIYRLNLQPKKK